MSSERITELLNEWSSTVDNNGDEALALVYHELRTIAATHLRRERSRDVLEATAIVHEAYLRLSASRGFQWRSRNHFFAFASRVMRRVLVDEARRRGRIKRGSGARPLTLSEVERMAVAPLVDLLEVDAALNDLSGVDRQKARVVELRFFAGLSIEETAGALKVSVSTVNRQWRLAKLWLHDRLKAT